MHSYYYTPLLWRVWCNSFDIVCLSVCLSVSLSQPNGQTYKLEFWHGGLVEGYLGQLCGSRSKVKVTRSNNVFNGYFMCYVLEAWDALMHLARKQLRNTTWGVHVLKADAVSWKGVLPVGTWPLSKQNQMGLKQAQFRCTVKLIRLPPNNVWKSVGTIDTCNGLHMP